MVQKYIEPLKKRMPFVILYCVYRENGHGCDMKIVEFMHSLFGRYYFVLPTWENTKSFLRFDDISIHRLLALFVFMSSIIYCS